VVVTPLASVGAFCKAGDVVIYALAEPSRSLFRKSDQCDTIGDELQVRSLYAIPQPFYPLEVIEGTEKGLRRRDL
jgi:hypothetical protein